MKTTQRPYAAFAFLLVTALVMLKCSQANAQTRTMLKDASTNALLEDFKSGSKKITLSSTGTLEFINGFTLIGGSYLKTAMAAENALTFSTGLTRTADTITVNTSQNINRLSNLTSNGLVTTSSGTGSLGITAISLGSNGAADAFKMAQFDGAGGLGGAYFASNTGGAAFSILYPSSLTFSNNSHTGTITFPTLSGDISGEIVTTASSGVVTNAMLAGSITFSKLVGTDITKVGTLTNGSIPTTLLSGTITNAQLAGSIAASKLVGTDITTVGTLSAGTIPTTLLSGTITNAQLAGSIDLTSKVTGALPLANGGSGQTTANAALNAFLPSQTGNSGKSLITDGTNTSWGTAGGGITIGSTSISGGTSGRLLTSGTTVGELTLGSGVSTWLGTPTVANLNTALGATVATTGANTFTTLQTITQGTANTGVLASTGFSLTGSNATSMINLAGALNTTGAPSLFKMAWSITSAAIATKYMEILAGASGTSPVFTVHAGSFGGTNLGGQGGIAFGDPNSGGNSFTITSGRADNSLYIGCTQQFGLDVRLLSSTMTFRNAFLLQWSSDGNSYGTPDLILARDGAGILAIKNSTNAQELRVYGTTSGSKYASLKHDGTTAILRSSSGGTKYGANGTAIAHIKRATVTLVAGTATVTDTDTTANSHPIPVISTAGGTLGSYSFTVSAGASYTINSSSVIDTSTLTITVIHYP